MMPTIRKNSISAPSKPRTLGEIIENKKELLEHAIKKREGGRDTYSTSKLMHMDSFVKELENTIKELTEIRLKMNNAWNKRPSS